MDSMDSWERLTSRPISRRRLLELSAGMGAGAMAGLFLAGCGGSEEAAPAPAAPAPAEPAPAEPAPAEPPAERAPAPAEPPAEPTTITFALDWVPNTNHTGFYVADARGYYAEEGITLEILPYNNVSPDNLVGSGEANFGISFGTSIPFSVQQAFRSPR